MELQECFRSEAAIRLICCEAGGSDSEDAEADIHSRVENVTQTAQRTPTVKKTTHSGSDHRNSKWFHIISPVIYIVPGTVKKN